MAPSHRFVAPDPWILDFLVPTCTCYSSWIHTCPLPPTLLQSPELCPPLRQFLVCSYWPNPLSSPSVSILPILKDLAWAPILLFLSFFKLKYGLVCNHNSSMWCSSPLSFGCWDVLQVKCLVCSYHFGNTFLLRGTARHFRLTLCFPTLDLELPVLYRALVLFHKEWYSGTLIPARCLLIATRVMCLSRPFKNHEFTLKLSVKIQYPGWFCVSLLHMRTSLTHEIGLKLLHYNHLPTAKLRSNIFTFFLRFYVLRQKLYCHSTMFKSVIILLSVAVSSIWYPIGFFSIQL